jgi:hypothetical protein
LPKAPSISIALVRRPLPDCKIELPSPPTTCAAAPTSFAARLDTSSYTTRLLPPALEERHGTRRTCGLRSGEPVVVLPYGLYCPVLACSPMPPTTSARRHPGRRGTAHIHTTTCQQPRRYCPHAHPPPPTPARARARQYRIRAPLLL